MKLCSCCGCEKGVEDFYSDKSKSDGRTTQCKVCIKRKRNAERQVPEVKERRKLEAREYRKRPEVKEHQNKRRKLNSDRVRRRNNHREWYCGNKDRLNSLKRSRRANDSFYNKVVNVRSIVGRIKRMSHAFNELLGCTYFEAQQHLYLNNHSSGIGKTSIDHIIPLSWAETEDELELMTKIENLHIIDLSENREKFDKIYAKHYSSEILEIYGHIIYRQILKSYE